MTPAEALRLAASACEAMPPQGQQAILIRLLSFHIIRIAGERHRADETEAWLELLGTLQEDEVGALVRLLAE